MKNFQRIVRRSEVLSILQISQSALYDRIKKGIWPTPISLGARAVGWLSSENTIVLNAMIAGKTESQIKLIVSELIAKRQGGLL